MSMRMFRLYSGLCLGVGQNSVCLCVCLCLFSLYL